jgi:hypothetical protein
VIGRSAAARTPVTRKPTFSTPRRLPFSDNQPQLWTAELSGAAAATGRSVTCNANFFTPMKLPQVVATLGSAVDSECSARVQPLLRLRALR